MYHIACINGKAICDTAAVQLRAVVRIFHVERFVQPQFSVFIKIGRHSVDIVFPVDMDAAAAD